ncbi:hypothetical protein chiPu_0003183 [Chiloscyllium punctatum]|uniref:Myb-like domain-containing protein n=1 Tax=Chiloscyllium punctatum TaxID=137246 RepID=A0A401S313_CHIPU|nr:hypothetical protein [Chiloscyllium punctatum]
MKAKLHGDHLHIPENHHLRTPQKTTCGLNGAVASVNGRVIENTFSVPTLPIGCQTSHKKDHVPVIQQSPAKIFLQMKQGIELGNNPLASVKLSEHKAGLLHSNQHGATFTISSLSNEQPTESIEAPQKSAMISSVDNTVKKTEHWNTLYLNEDTDIGNEGDNEMSQDVALNTTNSVSTGNQINCTKSAIQDFTDVSASSLQKIVHPDNVKMLTRSKCSKKENDDIQECKNLCNILLTSPKINIPRRRGPEVVESTPEDTNGLESKMEKRITLTKWIIQQIKGSNEICVEGKRDTDGIYWHSNVIAERIKQTEVKSITGSIYVLKGPLDYVAMKNQGFSNSILKHFFLGFPLHWKEYIEEFFKRREKGCHSKTRESKDARFQKLPSVKSRNLQDNAVLPHDKAKIPLSAKKKRMRESKIDNGIIFSYALLKNNSTEIYFINQTFTTCLVNLASEAKPWTKKELHCLHRTVSAIPKGKPDFWDEIAASVGTRSAEACQQKYLSEHQLKMSKRPNVKQKKKCSSNENKQGDPVKIVAHIGTLKRKQQVRSFLEQLPKEDHEDLFNDAVLQHKRIKLPSFPSSQEEDDDDDFMLQTNPTTPNSVIFPLAKTPQWNHISPRMLGPTDSANNDKYVFQLQKKSKMKNWSKVPKRSKPEFCMTPTRSKSSHLFEGAQKSNIGTVFKSREDTQSDDTEDEDYYFSVTD